MGRLFNALTNGADRLFFYHGTLYDNDQAIDAWIQPLRSVTDYDFASEQVILDGALDRYKVLVVAWAHTTGKPVLDRIARWVDAGGVVIYPERQHSRDGGFFSVEGDRSVWNHWQKGDTGKAPRAGIKIV